MPPDDYVERDAAAKAAFEHVLRGNGTPEQAAWYAAHAFRAKGIDPGEVAYGAIGLARDFDAQNGTALARDTTGMVRVIEAYVKVALEVRGSSGRGTVHLPFLVQTLHYEREFTARSLAALVGSARRSVT